MGSYSMDVWCKYKNKIYIYRNGNKEALTGAETTNGQLNTTSSIFIGNFYNVGFNFNGYIDDLRVYTGKVLTADEINRIYLNSKADYTTISEPLIGQDLSPFIWYKFDDSTNVGLDTMGNATMVQDGAAALPTLDTNAIRGSRSVKFGQAQTMRVANYNFDHITTEMTITFWIKINGLGSYGGYDSILINQEDQTKFYIYRSGSTANFGICIFGSGYLEGIFLMDYLQVIILGDILQLLLKNQEQKLK